MSRLPLALLAALLLVGLLARDAWPPDETRTADVARAMAQGDGRVVLRAAPVGSTPDRIR